MSTLDVVAAALVIIAAPNWGPAGAFHLDRGSVLFGPTFATTSPMSIVVYTRIGLAGRYQALTWRAIQRRWEAVSPVHA